jgi:2-methylisocitrate lyase-like PEP mutase family enzyme
MMNAERKRAMLAEALRGERLIAAPGVFEMISAKIADRMGFGALYLTGYGVAASHLGLPDAGLASYADVLERVRVVANGTSTPLICDADTGFGGLLNVQHTVRGFEDAGCAAVQLEDQQMPKKCGFTPGRRVVPIEEMTDKIAVALETRRDCNLLIVARTDARASLGLEESLLRAQAFSEAGADVVFVQALESADELRQLASRVDTPLLVNMGKGGTLPPLSQRELEDLGFRIAIYPNLGMLAAARALDSAYRALQSGDEGAVAAVPAYAPDTMHRLTGFEEVWAFERKWSSPRRREP